MKPEIRSTIIIVIVMFIIFLTFNSCESDRSVSAPGYFILDFDGIDDRVIVENPDQGLNAISNNITIECWIYARSYPNRAPRIVDRSDNKLGEGAGDRFLLHLFEPDSAVRMNINGNGLSSGPIQLNRWTHIASTYDGQEVCIYLDGSLSRSMFLSTIIDVQDSALYIGNDSNLTIRQFDGYIDELRIWCVAKSQDEIEQDMNRILGGDDTGLVGYWRMDSGQGQLVVDSAGDNHGTLGLLSEPDMSDPEWILWEYPHNH